MTRIVLLQKTNTILLATVLIFGTFALLSSSFNNDAQALEMSNNNFKKSFGKDVSVKYVKFNYINVNVNGLELDINNIPRLFDNELLAANDVEAETSANSFGSGMGAYSGSSGFDSKGVVFVCINNNNNAGREGGDETDECETCFTSIVPEEDLNGIIADFEFPGIDSLEDICNFIDENVQTEEGRTEISLVLENAFRNAEVDLDLLNEVLECLDEVYDVEIPKIMR